MMSDFNFKRTFRVDKMTAVRLVHMLQLHRENNRGLSFHPEQVLCIALNHSLPEGSAYCGDVSVAGAHQAIVRVRNKILELKEEYVHLPTAIDIEEKYRLPGFAYAVGGMLVSFDEAPRNIPQAYLSIMNHVH